MDVFNQIYLSLKNKMFVREVQYLQKNRNLAVTGFLSMVNTYWIFFGVDYIVLSYPCRFQVN